MGEISSGYRFRKDMVQEAEFGEEEIRSMELVKALN